MAFPLPIDPAFRIATAESWLDDVDDRLELDDVSGAELSWREAAYLVIKMEPGCCPRELEDRLVEYRVKLDQTLH